MADALRGSMDAAEYKHVVLKLIFTYISDAFEAGTRSLPTTARGDVSNAASSQPVSRVWVVRRPSFDVMVVTAS